MIKVLLVGCNGKMGTMISSAIKKFEDIVIAAGVDKNTDSPFGYPVFTSI